MRAFSLARLELRRFARGRLPRAAMVALLLLPLLYGALYLWSFWDPYGRLDRLPVALVNQDRAATVQGTRIDAGQQLTEELKKRHVFDWRETSPQEAAAGVASGRYYLSLTIPQDFSRNIGSSDSDHPEHGSLQVSTNDANNYIVGQISRSVFTEVRAATSAKASGGFYDRIFIGFSDLHDRTAKAAEGADQLHSGADQAHQGAGRLATGTGQAHQGAGELAAGSRDARSGADRLAAGLDRAKQGSSALAGGLADLDHGAQQLASGSKEAAAGTQRLADAVNPLAKDVSPLLHEYPDQISASAKLIADAAHEISGNLAKLPAAGAKALADARAAADRLDALYAQCRTDGTDCAALAQADQAAHQVLDTARQLDAAVQRMAPRLDELAADATRVERLARQLSRPGLAKDFDTAVADVNRLNTGVHRLATGSAELSKGTGQALSGARTLDTGLATLTDGARSLSGGLYQLSTGAQRLDSGLATLADGAQQLDSGLGRLSDGSGTLASGLHDGADQIPAYDKAQRDARAAAMSDPVQLARNELNKAPNYGTGFAPYFIPLALWVGAMVSYMLLRPLSPRALSANAPSWRIALAGWLPAAGIGVLQCCALLAVLHWGVGLETARTAGVVGYLLLTVGCFTAVMQWLNARFGPAGRLLALALLMLQLTSAGGTYPVETSPRFFGALHPFLPMSHVVQGLRRLISGGDLGPVWTGCAVLAAFLAAALALTALTARRRQVWSLSRLHPELAL
ncbi:YhgE/Pip domain-containing protein [Peterkaempfera bronchialis]|uniref:YhgE/Pip domain-containing protein n=1 Tax=Peterkaempfera bronchialis TaxID=2126346 RepID=A0A345STP2_9ACTN|nr:YhgE/Pip domain-containing protein [Peterkaempfera bronchialis]AXI77097.1 YhgE/Pip domain-containing protein [Peterkaempfera bronchialis]